MTDSSHVDRSGQVWIWADTSTVAQRRLLLIVSSTWNDMAATTFHMAMWYSALPDSVRARHRSPAIIESYVTEREFDTGIWERIG